MSDPFVTLGVARTATDAEIKLAFRKLAMQCHPDRNPGDAAAEARFKEINEAYQTLNDPQKKAQALNPQPDAFEFTFRTGGQGP
ncbi:MAG: molecular chaperone DnaJ, partial [Verrucomicrobiaceae bacterium]